MSSSSMDNEVITRNGNERYFFDIPIFSRDKKSWQVYLEKKKDDMSQNIFKKPIKSLSKEDSRYINLWFYQKDSHYNYGQMVGMIKLFAINEQIRGELWFVKERISKTLKRKKWHLYETKVFEYLLIDDEKNGKIFNWILNRLREENKNGILKNRYIDIEAFENSGRYIDYIELANF